MVNDLISIASFVLELASRKTNRKKQVSILRRALRIEIASNLNLLRTVGDNLNKGASIDAAASLWLLNSLSISTVTACLMDDPNYLKAMEGKLPVNESDKPTKDLTQDLESIAIKVTEMRAIANAPANAPLPQINWKTRFKNLRELHIEVIKTITDTEKTAKI